MTDTVAHPRPPAGVSLWQDAYRRLVRDRFAMLCLFVIAGYVLVNALAWLGVFVNHLHARQLVGPGWKSFADAVFFADYEELNPLAAKQGPSPEHWCGTNEFGQDMLARIANGARVSIFLGLMVAAVAVVLGGVLGAVAGWFGKWVDELVVWVYSTISSIPDIMLMVAIAYMIDDRGFKSMLLAMGLTYWVSVCRVIRAEFMKLKERDYVLAARALGLGNARIMLSHVAPNVLHLLIISFSLLFVFAIKAEVVLSFLGVGIVNQPSWGLIIQDAESELINGDWWQITFTSVALFGIVLALQVFSDALRDALDPRLRH